MLVDPENYCAIVLNRFFGYFLCSLVMNRINRNCCTLIDEMLVCQFSGWIQIPHHFSKVSLSMSCSNLPPTPQSAARSGCVGGGRGDRKCLLLSSACFISLFWSHETPTAGWRTCLVALPTYRKRAGTAFYRPTLPLDCNLCDIQRLKWRIGSRLSDLRRAVNYITVSCLLLICLCAVTAPVFVVWGFGGSSSRDGELLGGFHIVTHLINYLTVCLHIRGKHDFLVRMRKSVLA